jgi:hypothetical protein
MAEGKAKQGKAIERRGKNKAGNANADCDWRQQATTPRRRREHRKRDEGRPPGRPSRGRRGRNTRELGRWSPKGRHAPSTQPHNACQARPSCWSSCRCRRPVPSMPVGEAARIGGSSGCPPEPPVLPSFPSSQASRPPVLLASRPPKIPQPPVLPSLPSSRASRPPCLPSLPSYRASRPPELSELPSLFFPSLQSSRASRPPKPPSSRPPSLPSSRAPSLPSSRRPS